MATAAPQRLQLAGGGVQAMVTAVESVNPLDVE
jgi:hypothetical protein